MGKRVGVVWLTWLDPLNAAFGLCNLFSHKVEKRLACREQTGLWVVGKMIGKKIFSFQSDFDFKVCRFLNWFIVRLSNDGQDHNANKSQDIGHLDAMFKEKGLTFPKSQNETKQSNLHLVADGDDSNSASEVFIVALSERQQSVWRRQLRHRGADWMQRWNVLNTEIRGCLHSQLGR